MRGGTSVAIGEFRSLVNTGWMGTAGVSYRLPTGVYISGEFLYGENNLSESDGKSKLTGGLANLGYRFGSLTGASAYMFGSVGGLNHKSSGPGVMPLFEINETQFAYGGGVGVEIPLGRVSLSFEGRIVSTSDIRMLPFLAGIAISL